MKINISGIEQLSRKLNDKANFLPTAISRALNNTSYGGMIETRSEIENTFDRPTPFIKSGLRYSKSTPEALSASVYMSEKTSSILMPHIRGGGRISKRSEIRLRSVGFMLPNQYITPGPAAPIDQYGNISGGQMHRILSAIRAYPGKGGKSKKTHGMYVIFGVGVFVRKGDQAEPVLFFTKKEPEYDPERFTFHNTIKKYFENRFSANFSKAWKIKQ